jgi:hypothetical protein
VFIGFTSIECVVKPTDFEPEWMTEVTIVVFGRSADAIAGRNVRFDVALGDQVMIAGHAWSWRE